MSSILFILKDDALIVANTGKGFSRKGVVSICNMNLSAKIVNNDRAPYDGEYDKNDKMLVRSILKKRISKYGRDINDLIEDVNREDGATKSYVGRFVWELLQNADDVTDAENVNERLIGTKGLGFKSVLEITDEPEIYSGKFRFHFSRDKSRKMLGDVKKWKEQNGIPVCKLPHDKEPDTAVQKLLDEGYATVILLPLKEGAKELVENNLSKFCGYSLLFCQCLESVEIRTESAIRHIAIRRPKEGRKIELTENGKSKYWRVWRETKNVDGEKQISVSVCLPFDGEKISYCKKVPPLNVFFPTAEEIASVHAQIHASCEVEDNREHLGKDQPHREEICRMLKNMTKAILSEIPADAALQAFGKVKKIEDDTDDTEMAAQLANAIAEAVRETAFIPVIGGGMAKPEDVQLWKHGLGEAVDPGKVRDKNLCDPEINNNEEIVCILRELDAQQIPDSELAELLQFCRNTTEDDCLTAWDVAQLLMEETNEKGKCATELRKVPFWRVRNGQVRAIDSDIPLVKAKPQGCPEWLPVDVVDKDFWKRIQDKIKQLKEEKTLCDRILPLGKSEYFNQILLPYCEKQSPEGWRENGWKILEVALKWGKKDGRNEPLIIDSSNATESRTKIFHLPVGKGVREWVPAWQCYAGKAWGGLAIFDKYFANTPDRYVLSPSNAWEIDIDDVDRWKNLLTWLGCSWMPKMVQLDTLHPQRSYVRHTSSDRDFYFENFDDIFPREQNYKSSNYVPLLNIALEMYSLACKNKARYSFYKEKCCGSYALEQLQKNEWVPCKKPLLYPDKCWFAPQDVYLPGRGLGGLLPEVGKPDLRESKWSQIKDVFRKLNAKDSISDDAEKLIEYMNQLSECAGQGNATLKWDKKGKGKISRAAKAIFSAYAEIESPSSLAANVMVPCLRNTPKGEIIYFEKAENACWADEPYFGDSKVRRTILKTETLHVFFRFLSDGKKFGLRNLSEFLEMAPVYGDILPEKSRVLRARYKERRIGLMKATGKTLPEQLEFTAYDSITLKANSQVDINPEIKFWKQGECKMDVNAGGQYTMWRGLAAALGVVGNCEEYKSDFELLLEEKKWDDFLLRLQDEYNLTEESLEEVKEAVPSENNHEDIVATDARQGSENDHDDSTNTVSPTTISTPPRGTVARPATPGNHAIGNDQFPGQSSEIPAIEVVNYDWAPERNAPGRHSGGYGASHEAHEAGGDRGKRGEDALLEWLKSKFGDDNVVDMNKQNPNNPGYDIFVKRNGEYHYYECKSFASATPPRRVPITKTQHTKAECTKDRYWLCVIYDLNANPVKMLPPIADPAALEKMPTGYQLDLASRSRDADY